MSKHWLVLAVFGLALVVNPYLACSNSNESDFSYSEADMKDAVLGAWQGTADVDGETVEFSLLLEQASAESKTQSISAPKVQPQCSSRSFVKPAGACIALSQMPLVGSLTSVNPALNGAVDGDVMAFKDLDHVELSLRLEDGAQLAGTLEKETVADGRILRPQQVGTFSLSRP
jgi:hypothetical protein